jgi:hypothetical protein
MARLARLMIVPIITLCMVTACEGGGKNLPVSYHPVWESQSRDASQSMPCGGGDIGLNVWVENGDVLYYMARSGTFDENNTFVKLGRVRMRFSPNPFDGELIRQELVLEDGYVKISGRNGDLTAELRIWVDVYRPVIHSEIKSNQEIEASVVYESWRYEDKLLRRNESRENSYRWMPPDSLVKAGDQVGFEDNGVRFYHRNQSPTVFDVTVHQQGMDSVKNLMYDPLRNLAYGGFLRGREMEPAGILTGSYLDTDFRGWELRSRVPVRMHRLEIFLHTARVEAPGEWDAGLWETVIQADRAEKDAFRETCRWWNRFWERSYIVIQPLNATASPPDPSPGESPGSSLESSPGQSAGSPMPSSESSSGSSLEFSPGWQVGRNYQLSRYMLGCNAYGEWPTKFNGGLFTFDPSLVRPEWDFSPDFRNWGGGTFTAQNQRLVYFPMLKSGDFDMMRPQLDFYLRALGNAELRSRVYWGHEGACFTEQLENFGLPDCTEYGWERPEGMDPGMQYNAWLEYQWDTALEFCLMILQLERYSGTDISAYMPLIESCLIFFDRHYRYLARQRGQAELDSTGRLVLYPGSACETYKLARNATSTVAALQVILKGLLDLPDKYLDKDRRENWTLMLATIPSISFREIEGHTLIAPAASWERVQNTEAPQLYPVFPWRIYGVGKPGIDTAINTWRYDPDVQAFRDHISWKQYGIFAACLGLRNEAAEETIKKRQDSERRVPAFWGPGFDWVPDQNWGGSGMIGLQEMLLQANGDKILLFPAWPVDWDVHFKLHVPGNTVVEAKMSGGKAKLIRVTPGSRKKDIVLTNQ